MYVTIECCVLQHVFFTGINCNEFLQLLDGVVSSSCGIGKKRRSIDGLPLVRHERQTNIIFPSVTIDQSIVTTINGVQLSNVTLSTGE